MCVVFLSSCRDDNHVDQYNIETTDNIDLTLDKGYYTKTYYLKSVNNVSTNKFDRVNYITLDGCKYLTIGKDSNISLTKLDCDCVPNIETDKSTSSYYEYKDKNHKYLLVSFPECSECRITKGNNYSYTISVYSDAVSPALILETEQSIIPIEPIDGMRVVIKGIE